MRMKILACVGVVLASLASAQASSAAPAAKPEPVIRVVDIQEVMEKSTAVQGIRRELDVYRKTYDCLLYTSPSPRD